MDRLKHLLVICFMNRTGCFKDALAHTNDLWARMREDSTPRFKSADETTERKTKLKL